MDSFKVCIEFPEKWFCVWAPKLALYNLEPMFNPSEDSIQVFDRHHKNFIQNFRIRRKFFKSSKVCIVFPQKWPCYGFCDRRLDLGF